MEVLKNLLEDSLNENKVNELYGLQFKGQITTEMIDLAIKITLIKRKKSSKHINYYSIQKV